MSSDDNALGEFLRARRELLDPGELGVPDFGRRRVPGLRREELAMLAGVSGPYYTAWNRAGTGIRRRRSCRRSDARSDSTSKP